MSSSFTTPTRNVDQKFKKLGEYAPKKSKKDIQSKPNNIFNMLLDEEDSDNEEIEELIQEQNAKKTTYDFTPFRNMRRYVLWTDADADDDDSDDE